MSVAPDLLLRDNTLVVSVLAEGTDPRAWNCPVAEGPIPLLPQADDPYTWPAGLFLVSKHWEPSPAFPDLLRCQVAGRQGSDWQNSTSSARRDQGLTVCSLTLERLSGLTKG